MLYNPGFDSGTWHYIDCVDSCIIIYKVIKETALTAILVGCSFLPNHDNRL